MLAGGAQPSVWRMQHAQKLENICMNPLKWPFCGSVLHCATHECNNFSADGRRCKGELAGAVARAPLYSHAQAEGLSHTRLLPSAACRRPPAHTVLSGAAPRPRGAHHAAAHPYAA